MSLAEFDRRSPDLEADLGPERKLTKLVLVKKFFSIAFYIIRV